MRNGNTNAGGKLTELISIRVDCDVKELLQAKARQAGMSEAEYCRTLIVGRLMGERFMLEQYADTLRRVIGGKDDE